jgi:hypothetical protein
MSLEGAEVALKITGAAAKEIAVFLAAALKSQSSNLKLKGEARLVSMLKSGKALEIFSVKESDLSKFAQGAKQYGIVYCVLRGRAHSPDGLCDIMVKADDAPKISRLVERFKFATVDKAKIESDIARAKAEKAQEAQSQTDAEPAAPDKNDTEKLLDDLLGTDEGKTTPEKTEAEKSDAAKKAPVNPSPATTEKSPPSAPTSASKPAFARGTSSKPSVKEELREIKEVRAKKEADAPNRDARQAATPKDRITSTAHKQPQTGGKSKSKKSKERT